MWLSYHISEKSSTFSTHKEQMMRMSIVGRFQIRNEIPIKIEIIDIDSQVLLTSLHVINMGNNVITLDVSHISKGSHLLRISNANSITCSLLIIN